jgi:hypothetical protein
MAQSDVEFRVMPSGDGRWRWEVIVDRTQTLLAWMMRKFKRFAAHKIRAVRFLERIARENADLFVHWRLGMTGTFA